MASTALTVFVGFAKFWYGGSVPAAMMPDPTRVVQGVVTGIGFLCAGVIMKDGLSISGLTTAASIWAAAAIGILLGVGFYGAALMLALLCALSMSLLHRLETLLPSRATLGVTLTFREGFVPKEEVLARAALQRGYVLMRDSLTINYDRGQPVWKFAAVAKDKTKMVTSAQLAEELAQFDGVVSFSLQPARN
jgi:putative Mg2+ transporter-C (MgtC) family protein